jgi:type II secretory pathway component PulF
MPTFRYEADNRDGQRMSGEIAAPSREQAIARLSLDGLSAIRILEPSTLESSAGEAEIVRAEIVPAERQLSLAETVDLSALAAGLAASGLPLDTGLKAAALEAPNRRLSRALLAISRRLSAGLPLDEALGAQGERLPPHVRGLVLAGLHSGRMASLLEEFVAMERHAAQLRRRVALTLAYPAVLISVLLGAFAFFAAAVFPALAVILDDFDADLPAATQVAIGFSDQGVYALLGNVIVVFCAWLIIWLASDLPELCSMLKTFPLLGPIARWAALSRFARMLALLLEASLPLAESLHMAGDGARDADLASACRKAAVAIENGYSLEEALMLHSAFPRSLSPIVAWGRQAAALPEALNTAADMFEARLQSQLGLLRTAVPALTFLAVLWGALFLVAALLLPMIGLIEKLT